jgi:DNA-binding MarR family transcriptional regulator
MAGRPEKLKPAARAREALDQGALQALTGYNVRRAEVHMHQHFTKTLADLRIRPAEYSVLVLVDANPFATQADLAQALSIRRPNLVGLILRLERRGLLRRERYRHDRRNHMLSLAAAGKSLLRKVNRIVREMDKRVTRCWSDRERALVNRLLRRLYDGS